MAATKVAPSDGFTPAEGPAELKGLGIAVPDLAFLRARIKTIKTTYRSELSKVNDSKKSGASTEEIYVPKLQWFTLADSFLREVAITRNSKSNLDTQTTSKEEMNVTTADTETEEGAIEEDEGAIDDPHEENTSKSDAGADFQKPRTKIRRVTKLARIESTVHKLQQITANNRASTTSNVSADEVDLFGNYVAAQLKELPLRNRLTCQEKIQSMLTKERLALLASPEPPMSSPSPMLSGKSSYGNLSDDNDEYTTDQQTYTTDGPFLTEATTPVVAATTGSHYLPRLKGFILSSRTGRHYWPLLVAASTCPVCRGLYCSTSSHLSLSGLDWTTPSEAWSGLAGESATGFCVGATEAGFRAGVLVAAAA
ncbi:uncharacterized protein LOC128984603 [Macrosteles quadrilineatus]|uniref:uncharacterized protein LOC128984603 n=1 Tax=Macrosteles quadrilineatus TaxID=74068 RepID=UPI0023E1B3A9|nr:uncharacterized protein LOC128984603 [Macrosteles quadrilineatus]